MISPSTRTSSPLKLDKIYLSDIDNSGTTPEEPLDTYSIFHMKFRIFDITNSIARTKDNWDTSPWNSTDEKIKLAQQFEIEQKIKKVFIFLY